MAAEHRLGPLVIGLAAFTLQWLLDDRPPPVRRPVAAPVPIGA
jgi:hypothetical protein